MSDPIHQTERRLAASASIAPHYLRDEVEMEGALARLIRSASGWRSVFAASEEDRGSELSETHREIVVVAGDAYSSFLIERAQTDPPVVALGTDTRPTGPAIASLIARALIARGIEVRYLGVSAAPEIMAHVRRRGLNGFVYVSASHNPIGHNGLKFGLDDGGVVGGADAQQLIHAFNERIAEPELCQPILDRARRVPTAQLTALDERATSWKEQALEDYLEFTIEVGTMSADQDQQNALLDHLRVEASQRQLGILADFNGSARTRSIDRALFERLGLRFEAINDQPGQIVHTIVPEGASLEPCRQALEQRYAANKGFLLGYVPDNDGDRGNIVFVDPRTGKAESLRAQEVFALAVMAELSSLVYSGRLAYSATGRAQQRHAVVVNGPTSLRIDAIAKAFDVQVFRAEVGEANVVNLARDSRGNGFHIRIMGEGSNGGNITHPASVRDPMNTLFAFLKLITFGSRPGRPGLYEIWCKRSGTPFDPKAGIREMVNSLPSFVTTDVNDPRAVVDIQTTDHARLKEAYEELFLVEWDDRKAELEKRFGIATWEEINYEGMNEIHGFGKSYRSGRQKGGLKILFKNDHGHRLAFIWMRGSGTEPVFRVLADVQGTDEAAERWLLDWHVSMIQRADAKVATLLKVAE